MAIKQAGFGFKAQSAMEYIMTYFWMLLIIGIMLLALYEFGIFGTSLTGPRAFPGSCQVIRGVTSSSSVLQGVCNSELPEFTAYFRPGGKWSNNCAQKGTCIGISPPFPDKLLCNVTMMGWSYDLGMGPNGTTSSVTYNSWLTGVRAVPSLKSLGGVYALVNGSPENDTLNLEYNDSIIRYEIRNYTSRNQIFFLGNFKEVWLQTAMELSNGIGSVYMDGKLLPPLSGYIGCLHLGNGSIGTWDSNFNGLIANIQIYNTSLSQSEIQMLYIEGVGGDPIDLKNLAAWYPLNGNTQDYSGSGLSGHIYNYSYSGIWASNYTPP